ncbi:MAG TPA: DUF5979 domain-containing protein, partial [Acidimicrobiales bacterium]|nr:DUF5979 domain-containing protein [Acidimicrobiales bacterium]
MTTNQHRKHSSQNGIGRKVRSHRGVAMVLALLLGFVVASTGIAAAEDVAPEAVTEEVVDNEAVPTDVVESEPTTTPEPKKDVEEAAEPVETTPTPTATTTPPTTVPETTSETTVPGATPDTAITETISDKTISAAEPDLRPLGDIGMLSADEPKAQQEVLAATSLLEPGQVVVTQRSGVNGCQGALPTPGSGNTDKRLIGGTLTPGGTAVFEISYPVDPADVTGRTTFEILDCVFIGGVAVLSYDISFVPNTANFIFSFTLNIPASAPIGSAYCNVAKTTAAPSAPQQSNRKAGPACFMIGGDLRVLKVDVSGASLAGATFSVTCVPPTVPPGTFLPPIVIEGVARNTFTGVIDDGLITIAGPQGTVCTVTETIPPPGYELAIPATQTATIGATQVTLTFVNRRATGSLVVNKTTTGGTGTFTFVVDCSNNAFDQTVTIVNSGSRTITDIPTGTVCSVTENAATGYTSTVTTGSSPVTIGSGNNTIGFTNVRNTGSLVINKTTTGGTGTFTFVVDCSDNAFDQTVTIVNSGSQTITGIPTGTVCSVTENAATGFTSTVTTGS